LLGGLQWSDVTLVAPLLIQDYRPQNYAGEYLSEATYYNAFYRSLNTPAVELGQKIGLKNVIEMAKRLGVKTELKNQAGTLLGGSEVTLMDMASVYATLANHGEYIEPRMITKITDREDKILWDASQSPQRHEQVVPEAIAYMMVHAMQAVFRYGTASHYSEWAKFAAGKTGTTNEAKDNWFGGLTTRLSGIVWVGTDGNLAFDGSAGANTLALPLWIRIMQKARTLYPSGDIEAPSGITQVPIHPLFGFRTDAGIQMPFLEGQEPTRFESAYSTLRDTGAFRDYLDR
jgi:penicillin-binding protein 1A